MASRFSTSCVFTETAPNTEIKEITVTLPLSGSGATVALTLTNYGISSTGLLTVKGTSTSTTYGIIVVDAPTTAVSSGVLTITSGTETGVKTFRVTGESN